MNKSKFGKVTGIIDYYNCKEGKNAKTDKAWKNHSWRIKGIYYSVFEPGKTWNPDFLMFKEGDNVEIKYTQDGKFYNILDINEIKDVISEVMEEKVPMKEESPKQNQEPNEYEIKQRRIIKQSCLKAATTIFSGKAFDFEDNIINSKKIIALADKFVEWVLKE